MQKILADDQTTESFQCSSIADHEKLSFERFLQIRSRNGNVSNNMSEINSMVNQTGNNNILHSRISSGQEILNLIHKNVTLHQILSQEKNLREFRLQTLLWIQGICYDLSLQRSTFHRCIHVFDNYVLQHFQLQDQTTVLPLQQQIDLIGFSCLHHCQKYEEVQMVNIMQLVDLFLTRY